MVSEEFRHFCHRFLPTGERKGIMLRNHGIPTLYAGVRFRSRLEARWAAFFDEVGWSWEYEPFDCEGYIPDFVILGEMPLLVDVKPALSGPELWQRADELVPWVEEWKHDMLVVGVSPLLRLEGYEYGAEPGRGDGQTYGVGLLGEALPDDPDVTGDAHCYSLAVFARCPDGHGFGVAHHYQSFRRRPCGHYDGGYIPQADPRNAWGKAVNAVQWKGRDVSMH